MLSPETNAASENRLEAFRSSLLNLDVASDVLRRDPSGRTWLDAEFYSMCQEDPEWQAVLEEWVEEELELFGSVRERGDPLFTQRVLQATVPAEVAGVGLDPRWRSPVITIAYATAILVTLVVLIPLLRGWANGEGLFTALRHLTN